METNYFISPFGVKIYAPVNDSLIHATLRACDLIPAFVEAIKETSDFEKMANSGDSVWLDASKVMGENFDENAPFWESEDAFYLLEDLFDILDHHAPNGYYFGAHPGDASDFGYWANEAID
jgi:hypothetical protein